MAKGQVTEGDLAQSIQTLGGFGNLAADKPRRDSPFGSEFVKRAPVPSSERPTSVVSPSAVPVVPAAPDPEVRDKGEEKPTRVVKPLFKPERSRPTESVEQKRPKAETLTERITLQMSPEMRDKATELARGLQRKRKDKSERITANTIMRVGIRFLLDEFDPDDAKGASTEEELFDAIRARFRVKENV